MASGQHGARAGFPPIFNASGVTTMMLAFLASCGPVSRREIVDAGIVSSLNAAMAVAKSLDTLGFVRRYRLDPYRPERRIKLNDDWPLLRPALPLLTQLAKDAGLCINRQRHELPAAPSWEGPLTYANPSRSLGDSVRTRALVFVHLLEPIDNTTLLAAANVVPRHTNFVTPLVRDGLVTRETGGRMELYRLCKDHSWSAAFSNLLDALVTAIPDIADEARIIDRSRRAGMTSRKWYREFLERDDSSIKRRLLKRD